METLTPSTFPPPPAGVPNRWPPPALGPPPPPRRRRARLWVVIALIGGLAVAVAAGEEAASYPKAWDSRVTDLVDFVAAERGLPFKHPVYVDFLTETEFRDEVTVTDADLDAADRQAVEDDDATSRAVGLPTGDVGLFEAGNTLTGDGTLAFYDHGTKRITIRGTELTVGRRVTVVHELTHALQDQYFDLSRNGSYETDARDFAFEALVEGDATRIENAYLATLSGDELKAYDTETFGEDSDAVAEKIDSVPSWLTAYWGAPYSLGELFVSTLVAEKGRVALDKALQDPPASEEQIYNITRYLGGDEPRAVDAPALAGGDREIRTADFGALGLMFMLAERIPALAALQAADDWGGDAYVAFERAASDTLSPGSGSSPGQVCTVIRMVGDTAAATGRLGTALDQWAAAMPADHHATVTRSGETVEVSTCDPGPQVATADERHTADEVMRLLMARSLLIQIAYDNGADDRLARCTGDESLKEFTIDELESDQEPADFAARITQVGSTCRAVTAGGAVN